jgi:cytochrome b
MKDDANSRRILVWDAPTRVFHWLMVLSFFGAYLSAESERWRLIHVTLGYTMAALVGFRVVWGLLGTRYARFAEFVRSPAAALRYLTGLARGRPQHYVGHNPAGAFAIIAMLLLACAVTVTGWAAYNDIGGDWFEELHEGTANMMLALVGIHVLAVVISSWLHHENLVRAMISGYKTGQPEQGIRRAWWSIAGLMLVAMLVFWWIQWQSAP